VVLAEGTLGTLQGTLQVPAAVVWVVAAVVEVAEVQASVLVAE